MSNNYKVKILYVITKSNWGGAQRYVFDMATSLPHDRFDVLVALGGSGALAEKLMDADIRILTLQSLGRDIDLKDDWQTFIELLALFKKERPDVIHLNSSKIGGLGALAGRLAGVKKIIFTAHGWAFNEPRPLWQRLVIKKLHWITVMLTTTTIAVSETTKRQLRLPFMSRRITVIHNGIAPFGYLDRAAARASLATLAADRIDLSSSERLKAAIADPWIGTIAELHKNKGLTYALEALATLKDAWPIARFVVIGEGEERGALERLIREQHLEERVFLLGAIDEAPRLLKAFDIFLFPSIKEGFPYAVLEAGLVSVPVIASRTGGIPEIIENEKTGLLAEPGAPAAIASALKKLIDNPVMRENLASNLTKKVSHDFTRNRMVAKTIAEYI